MSNIAADTTQRIRRDLETRGWREVKSQHFQFPRSFGRNAPEAIEVGYVLGECTVKIIPVDRRGAEGAMHTRLGAEILRGVGDEFVREVLAKIIGIEDAYDDEH